jgi:hypothetical protein
MRKRMTTAALLAFVSCAAPPPPPRPVPPGAIFPIGIYVAAERLADAWDAPKPVHLGRPSLETWRRDLDDMARHHINVVAIENTSAIPVETLRTMIRDGFDRGVLTWASENGLPPEKDFAAWTRGRHALLKDEPGLLAWSLWDEPLAEDLPRWLRLKAMLEAADPTHPILAVTHGGPKGFERHAAAHAHDFYPILTDAADPAAVGPMVRRYVDAAGPAHIWFVQQAFHGEGRRLPTPAESRLMTFAALANGAKGIFHFIYDHLTDPINSPTPLWEEIGAMSARLAAFGPLLLDTTPVDPVTWIEVEGKASFAVLASPAGHAIAIVYNPSPTDSADVRVRGVKSPIHALEPGTKLAPGDGRFYWLGASPPRVEVRQTARAPGPLDDVQRELAELWKKIGAIRGRPEFRAIRNRYWGLASRFLALAAGEGTGDWIGALKRQVRSCADEVR